MMKKLLLSILPFACHGQNITVTSYNQTGGQTAPFIVNYLTDTISINPRKDTVKCVLLISYRGNIRTEKGYIIVGKTYSYRNSKFKPFKKEEIIWQVQEIE